MEKEIKFIPAFPTENEGQTGPHNYHYSGMSLRDYFAAKAMQGYISNANDFVDMENEIGKWSYEVADTMLKAREGQNVQNNKS